MVADTAWSLTVETAECLRLESIPANNLVSMITRGILHRIRVICAKWVRVNGSERSPINHGILGGSGHLADSQRSQCSSLVMGWTNTTFSSGSTMHVVTYDGHSIHLAICSRKHINVSEARGNHGGSLKRC